MKTYHISKSFPPSFLSLSLSRTELTDHRPARVLEVFLTMVTLVKCCWMIRPTQLAFRRTINVYLHTYLLTYLINKRKINLMLFSKKLFAGITALSWDVCLCYCMRRMRNCFVKWLTIRNIVFTSYYLRKNSTHETSCL